MKRLDRLDGRAFFAFKASHSAQIALKTLCEQLEIKKGFDLNTNWKLGVVSGDRWAKRGKVS